MIARLFNLKTKCFCCERRLYHFSQMKDCSAYSEGIGEYLVGYHCPDCEGHHPFHKLDVDFFAYHER